jgi:hypothetical protein
LAAAASWLQDMILGAICSSSSSSSNDSETQIKMTPERGKFA